MSKKDDELKKLEKKAYGNLATAKGVGPINKAFRLALHRLRKKGLKDEGIDDDTKEKVLKGLKGGGLMKYKKGGKVKRMSCPVDGMAKRGKTKARRKGR